jgi:hypothetical protein
MSAPTTDAGRALLARLTALGSIVPATRGIVSGPDIATIEDEACQQERDRIAAAVEGGWAAPEPSAADEPLPFEPYAEPLDVSCAALADRLERLFALGGPAEALSVASILRHFGEHWTDAMAGQVMALVNDPETPR